MSNKNNLAKVYHFDLYGKREDKYEFLNKNSLDTIEWNELAAEEPNFFFVKKNFEGVGEYEKGFKIDEFFTFNGAGVQTKRDNLFIDFDKTNLTDRIGRLLNNSLSDKEKADLNIKNSSSFRLLEKIKASSYQEHFIKKYNYRVFDDRNIYYDKNLLGRAFYNIMKNMLEDNIGIIVCKQQSTFDFQHSFITKNLTDHNSISLQTKEASFLFPLYLYPETSGQQSTEQTTERKPNLNPAIVQEIADGLGLVFVPEKDTLNGRDAINRVSNSDTIDAINRVSTLFAGDITIDAINRVSTGTFAPIDILDYIYAVLHSPTYREKYKEFLKIDFPRVPYPKDQDTFWQLVKLGGELRQIHLLESAVIEKYITQYPVGGDNVVTKISFSFTAGEGRDGVVYINETQYFGNVPEVAWNFYIGGYQPAQKWLKDRKGRELSMEDILHYQKIIVALMETDRIMKEIDEIEVE